MAIALALPALGVMCVILIALLIAYAVEGTVGALLQWVAKQLSVATIHIPYVGSFNPFGPLITILNAAADELHVIVAGLIAANAWAFHVFVRANAYAWQELSAALGDLADGTSQTLEWLWHSGIAGQIENALLAPARNIHWLLGAVHQLAHDAAEWVAHPERIIGKTITKVEHIDTEVTKTITRTVPAAIVKATTVVLPGIKGIARDYDSLSKRLGSLSKYLTIGGIAGLVGAAVFSEFGLGWLRCSNVGKVGRALCGLDRLLLDALLAGLAVWLGTIGIEAFAKDVQKVTLDIEGEVRKFWRGNVSGPGGDRALGQTGL